MKVVLVTSFNANWIFGRVLSPYIPLNLLILGACLRNNGHEVGILDQTLALLQGKTNDDDPESYRRVVELIHAAQPDVVGLTTMCNSYPQTLSLARHYREIDPQAKIILGGPQATVTDLQTLKYFPWIDAVVRGEAENSLPELINCWENDDVPGRVAGITWRGDDGRVYRNEDAPLLQDIDSLPFPAYDLYPLDQIDVRLIPIEGGRGCPYGCTFCSTSRFFKRRYRIKSVQRLIAEMKFFYENYGFNEFELVHDNLTVSRRWVEEFCQALLEGDYPFKWGSGARIDSVDADMLAEMARAGCIGIYYGVETGSQRLQPIIKKKLKLENALPIVRASVENKIRSTSSFIIGFPDETVSDMLDSFNMALDVIALAPDTLAQMHLLAPLLGSPLYEKHKGELQFDGHSSDFSLFLLSDAEVEVVRRYPEIFANFYYIPTPELDRDLTKATSAALYTCPTLFIALRHAGLSAGEVLTGWVTWMRKHLSEDEIDRDYYFCRFGLDFCRYLRAEVLDLVAAKAPFLGDMVDCFEIQYALQRGHISEKLTFHQFEYDVLCLEEKLRTNAPWADLTEPAPTGVLFINLAFKPERGFVYLEVRVPDREDLLVRPGDKLEIRDPIKQLQTRPHLVIRNNTRKQVFVTKHHIGKRELRAMGL